MQVPFTLQTTNHTPHSNHIEFIQTSEFATTGKMKLVFDFFSSAIAMTACCQFQNWNGNPIYLDQLDMPWGHMTFFSANSLSGVFFFHSVANPTRFAFLSPFCALFLLHHSFNLYRPFFHSHSLDKTTRWTQIAIVDTIVKCSSRLSCVVQRT